jgi:cobalt/nickel transport system permease protein
VFFQYGGITTLGVNTVVMAAPAVTCHYLFGPLIVRGKTVANAAAFGCGFAAVLMGALLVALFLMATGEQFFEIAALVVMAHIPVMIIEGIVTAFAISFLKKVYPDLLPGSRRSTAG